MSFLSWLQPSQRARIRRSPASAVVADEDIEAHIHILCTPSLSRTPGNKTDQISTRNIQNLQTFLAYLDSKADREVSLVWSHTPRTYGILHSIGGHEFMDEFRAKGFNDYHLPYNERTLPDFLQKKDGKNLRQAFLDAQSYFLTDAKLVETDGASTHFVDENGDNIFQPIRSLGQGSYGGVDLVYSRLSLRHYARKRVLRGRDSERSREGQRTLIAELKHLKQLSHRHLVKIIASYTDLEYISYIMEPVAESDLARRLATPGMISTEQQSVLRRFYGCLAGAVNYLHQNKIRHRDITARNILIYQDEVYISDFGSAYSWSNRPASATRHHYTPVSPDYQAPEVAKREERDSKSDMFSLGVVFLEMTTKLLGRSIADLKRVISMNARRHNSDQPYVHANLPVALTWLDELRKGNTVEHDNEPLVWVRDLLQEKPRNRPSAKGLMKDILESPSFRSFCCFKCQGEFEERAFEYDAGVQRDEPMEDIKATKNTVADIFDQEGSSSANGISLQKSESVEQWLGVTVIDRGSKANMPGAFPEIQDAYERVDDARRIDDTSVLFSATQYQSWYDTAELHEGDRWCAQSVWANEAAESIPQAHNIASPTVQSDLTAIGSETSGRERNLHDTGLGFMEYVSSDSEEDAEPQMFEEYSDSSETSSENESASTPNIPSKANTSTKELGIIVEVDESQSEEGALEEDDNNAYKFEEESDDSTIEETEALEQELRTDNLEPMGDSVDSYSPRGKARSDVELPFSTVARTIKNPYTDVNLEETAVKGPKAVTCEDDPDTAIPDLPRDECRATLDLAGPVLIEWSAEHDIKQGPSVLDESYKSLGQPGRSLESSLDDVSQSAENIDGIRSPSSTTSQIMQGEGQIRYGNTLISYGQDTTDTPPGAGLSDVQQPNTNNDSISEETEQVERTVRFALPSPSSPQYTEPPLNLPGFTGHSRPQSNSLIPGGDDSEGILLDFRMRLKQLEQESASEQNSQRPALEASSTERECEALTQISSRELEAHWAANSPEDGRHELEHNVGDSLSDVNAELQTQLDSGIFFATETRGVFSRRLPPKSMVPRRHKAHEALRAKTNLSALDIANTTDETATGRSLQSTPIPRLPLTAANVKALRDAAHRPSPNQNSSSLQLQGSTPTTLPRPQPDLPDSHETNQTSSHMGSSSSRNPRQRTALPTINAKSLMKTAWESASASAPTSVMSDATKARLSRVLVPYNQYDRMQNLLKDYCKQGKASAVKFLLQKGCNPGTRKTPRRGPLLAAIQGASGRHNKCVRELIKHDVDVNIKSKKSGKSALHLAVENDPFQGYVKLVWLLVNAGAETNMPDENGDFPLTKVFFGAGSLPLEKNRLEALAVLLKGGAEPNLHASGTGNTPLHLAVRRQDKWAVAMLLHKGADVNAKNSSGATPLQMTANQFRGDLGHDHAQVLDLLLQAKARIDERAGALSRTALHLAIISGTAHAVKLLLDYGADPLLADKNGNTAIMLAIRGAAKMTTDPEKIEDHVEVMDRLVKRLGPSWTHASSPKGVCAVETACSGYNMDLLKALLVEGNLDPRSKFREGTVVEFARATGTPRVKEVIERYMDKKRTME